jgi:hypothetical protein
MADELVNCDCLQNPPPLGTNTPLAGGLPSGVQIGATAAAARSKSFVWQVQSGDQNMLTVRLTLRDGITPVTPGNSLVTFTLAETQFNPQPIWTGDWLDGIVQKDEASGVVEITIPNRIMDRLRRGGYVFAVRVSDRLKNGTYTAFTGSMLVEYAVGGPQHDIPYKHDDDAAYRDLNLTKFNGKVYYLGENGLVQWFELIHGMVFRNGETWPP